MRQDRYKSEEEIHEGNIYFEHKYPSIRLIDAIEDMDSYEEFERYFTKDLMDENLLLSRYLDYLLKKYGTNGSKVAEDTDWSDRYVRKVVDGSHKSPARDLLLAICVVIGATVEETQVLLRYSGLAPLYARRKRDAIIWFALKKRPMRQRIDGKGYLDELNFYLFEHGYQPLQKKS